jgi:threonine aldolase
MTISFERSLSCPGGAVVIGSQDVIKKIKIKKKALGGSMGQTGIITAGCLWALDNLLPEIQRDNEIARFLAEKLF